MTTICLETFFNACPLLLKNRFKHSWIYACNVVADTLLKMIYVFYPFLIQHTLQMLPDVKFKCVKVWATPQDHADHSKRLETADLTIDVHKYENEIELHLVINKLENYHSRSARYGKICSCNILRYLSALTFPSMTNGPIILSNASSWLSEL